MKYFSKKILSLILVFVMLLSVSIVVQAESSAKQKAISVLLTSGWKLSEIKDLLTDDAILEFANASPALTSTKKYFKVESDSVFEISEDECMQAVQAIEENKRKIIKNELSNDQSIGIMSYGDIEIDEETTDDGYLTYYVQSYELDNDQYILSARFEWLIEPINRRIDVFGLGHDTNLTQLSSYEPYYVYKADITQTAGLEVTSWTDETYTPDAMEIDPGGTVISQDLINDIYFENYSYIAENHRGYLQYKVEVNNPNVTVVSIYTEYLHQQGLWAVSPGISYPAGCGISVTFSTFFKRMSPNPYLSFYV